jgi:hypothetical protein
MNVVAHVSMNVVAMNECEDMNVVAMSEYDE